MLFCGPLFFMPASPPSSQGSDGEYDPSFDVLRSASIYPRQYLLQVCKELLPPALGTLIVLRLIRPEARLLQVKAGIVEWGDRSTTPVKLATGSVPPVTIFAYQSLRTKDEKRV